MVHTLRSIDIRTYLWLLASGLGLYCVKFGDGFVGENWGKGSTPTLSGTLTMGSSLEEGRPVPFGQTGRGW